MTALAVFAHPDDAELACGGTLAGWARAGRHVEVLCVCAGEKGSSERVDGVELAARRADESRAAAAALGVAGWDTLGVADGEVGDDVALRGELVRRIRALRPEVVVTSDPTAAFFGATYVNHRDHRQVGWAVLDAVSPAAANPNYFPDAGEAHRVGEVLLSGSLEPDWWIDVADHLDAKVAAIRCHASQLGAGSEVDVDEAMVAEMVTARARAEGRASGPVLAERFRRLRLS